MNYWLMKSEPGEFSIDDLQAAPSGETFWDGVRNYQARNFMRDDMKVGDGVLYYHSNCPETGVVGIATVCREAYPDHTAFDPEDNHFDPKSDPDNPRWCMVDIRFERQFTRVILLRELRQFVDGPLRDMLLLRRGNRLSITPVTGEEWDFILNLE